MILYICVGHGIRYRPPVHAREDARREPSAGHRCNRAHRSRRGTPTGHRTVRYAHGDSHRTRHESRRAATPLSTRARSLPARSPWPRAARMQESASQACAYTAPSQRAAQRNSARTNSSDLAVFRTTHAACMNWSPRYRHRPTLAHTPVGQLGRAPVSTRPLPRKGSACSPTRSSRRAA